MTFNLRYGIHLSRLAMTFSWSIKRPFSNDDFALKFPYLSRPDDEVAIITTQI